MSTLTQEEKNLRILKALGWTQSTSPMWDGLWRKGSSGVYHVTPPDHFNDLNACAEMRRGLDQFQRALYECKLVEITSEGSFNFKTTPVASMHYCDALSAMHATAAQRAEAFGLTLGLWE